MTYANKIPFVVEFRITKQKMQIINYKCWETDKVRKRKSYQTACLKPEAMYKY